MKLSDVNLLEEIGNKENKDLHKAPPPGDIGELVSTAQAAKILGVTQSRVRQLIMDGELKSEHPVKGRRDNFLRLSQVKSHKEKMHGPGRPEKKDAEKA